MSEAVHTEYSLWFGVSEEAEHWLLNLIGSLSRHFDTPQFKPHITLLGSIRTEREALIAHVDRLSQAISPFDVEFDGIGETEAFFRCVFIKVKPHSPPHFSPHFSLVEIYRQTAKFFGKDRHIGHYMPHISLVYGNLPAQDRQTAAQQVHLPVSRIRVSKLQVVQMFPNQAPEQWRIVEQRQLRRNGKQDAGEPGAREQGAGEQHV